MNTIKRNVLLGLAGALIASSVTAQTVQQEMKLTTDLESASPEEKAAYQRIVERINRTAPQPPTIADYGLTCPDGPDLTLPAVTAAVERTVTGNYIYRYTVKSDGRSQQDITTFAVDYDGAVTKAAAPKKWAGARFNYRSTWGWTATSSLLRDETSMPGDEVLSKGEQLGGFSIESALPPGPQLYYVEGAVAYSEQIRNVGEAEADALQVNCPKYERPFPEYRVTGVTVGPSSAVPLTLALDGVPVAAGVLSATIKGSSKIPVSTVVQDSIRVGTGRAVVSPASVSVQDQDADGALDLVLSVPEGELKRKCHQRSLVVEAKTLAGSVARGAVEIPGSGCIQ